MKTLTKLMMLVLTVSTYAQSTKEMQYAAYLKASKTMWERSIERAKKESGEESFEVAMAMYGLLNNTMATEDEDTFDDYKDITIDLLEKLIEDNPEWGEPHAVLSSTYGLVMAYSPWKGMYLGSKSSSLMEKAVELQSDSPLVQKLFGGSKLYTPEMFGGDPKVAVEAFKKSLELFESDDKANNWLYLDTMMGLAMAYRKTDQNNKAKLTLEKAVTIEPQYQWAKSVLDKINKS
ncbi:tetratricopeptide repeat protein [Ekhidna sp. MALMAid0563]|uniref:tetratricopeptide repeat protein n=1 Tax=Ekhidna sp. MALMAid0563 TaxID=3143937 RepID=UPI0032DE9542